MTIPQDRQQRPPLVALIAIYEIAYGCATLLYFAHLWLSPNGDHSEASLERLFSFVVLVYGVGTLVIGFGIWHMKGWARHALLLKTGLGSARALIRHVTSDWIFGRQISIAPVILVDLAIWLSLMYYPDLAAAFGEREEED